MKHLCKILLGTIVAFSGMTLTGCGLLWTSVGTDATASVGVSTGTSYMPYYSPYYSPYYGSTWYPYGGGYWPHHWHRPWNQPLFNPTPTYHRPTVSGFNPGRGSTWGGSSRPSILPPSGSLPNLNGSNPGIVIPPAGSGLHVGR